MLKKNKKIRKNVYTGIAKFGKSRYNAKEARKKLEGIRC